MRLIGRRAGAGLVTAVLLLGGCGSEPSDSSDTTTTEAAASTDLITSDGHGDGEHQGHLLAVGANTEKDAAGRFVLHNGDEGPDVERLQNRLVELGAPLGEPDGVFGDLTLHAVMAFQRSEGLTPDGVVGEGTWAALDAPAKDIDWALPEVPDEYDTSPVSATVPETTSTSAPAQTGDGSSVGPHAPSSGDPAKGATWAKAVVTLSNQTATFYDGAGKVVLRAPISSGKNGLTPVGTFHVQSKSARAYAGGGSGVYMNTMTRFNGGIGFHSIPKRADGSDLPTPLGQAPVSHGCIRMADAQAKQVFENLPIGATVEVHA